MWNLLLGKLLRNSIFLLETLNKSVLSSGKKNKMPTYV